MNPFLEPTVATPRPCEGRHWQGAAPAPAPVPAVPAPGRAVSRPPAGVILPSKGGNRPAAVRRRRLSVLRRGVRHEGAVQRVRSSFRRAGMNVALCTLMLAGTLLMSGVAGAVDVNAATAQQLQEIKGIGPKMARVIIEERERGGRFESMSDLAERVKGIGPKKAAGMASSGLSVGAAAAQKPPAQAAARRRP